MTFAKPVCQASTQSATWSVARCWRTKARKKVLVAERIHGKPAQVNYDTVPSVIYTHPEVSWVGKTEEECKKKAFLTKPALSSLLTVAHWLRARAAAWLSHCTRRNRPRVGCAHRARTRVTWWPPLSQWNLASAVDLGTIMFAHSTVSEALHEAAMAVDGAAIHIANRKTRLTRVTPMDGISL